MARIWNPIDEKGDRIYLSVNGFDQADFYVRTVLKIICNEEMQMFFF